MNSASPSDAIYYTRCPVPTASGIAYQRQMFDAAFAGTRYQVRDLQELGPAHRDAHYTHSIERFFREGGGAPPIWARSRGVDSVLLGITFMRERLGIYVRADDPAVDVAGLAGRRIALPVWPRLVFNFWRFAAEKGIASALEVHGMREADVTLVDVTEGWDPHERRAVDRSDPTGAARCEYRAQLQALLAGEVDALFGKGPEAALLEREAQGRIRLLYDVSTAPELRHRVNNSTPRLLTTSRALLDAHYDAVVRYLATLLQAAHWAGTEPQQACRLMARECAVDEADMHSHLAPGFIDQLAPGFDTERMQALREMKAFLLERGYLANDFDPDAWAFPQALDDARSR